KFNPELLFNSPGRNVCIGDEMKRIIAGATGFIGQQLTKRWLAAGHQIVAIGRSRAKIKQCFGAQVQALEWQELNTEIIQNAQVVVNLAGANIGAGRWTTKRRQQILDSRVNTTRQLAELCARLGAQSPALFNASAVGVYGLQTSMAEGLPPALDETTTIDFQQAPDFLAKVGRAWELAALPAKNAGARVVWMRFGVVLAKHGGVLPRLALPVRFFLGGPMGSGQQPFSWISLVDLLNAIDFLLDHSEINGAVNLVAPGCVTQKQFIQALAKVLHRPSFFPLPAIVLKLLFGQMAEELLLKGQRVYPKRLLELGFQFKYPKVSQLDKIISSE